MLTHIVDATNEAVDASHFTRCSRTFKIIHFTPRCCCCLPLTSHFLLQFHLLLIMNHNYWWTIKKKKENIWKQMSFGNVSFDNYSSKNWEIKDSHFSLRFTGVMKSGVSQWETCDPGALNLTLIMPSRLPYTLCPLGSNSPRLVWLLLKAFGINCQSILC